MDGGTHDGALKKEMTMKNCGSVFSNEFLMETIKSLASVDFHGRHEKGEEECVCACVCEGHEGARQTNVSAPFAGDSGVEHRHRSCG